jgi:hypothetical protein
MGYYRIVYQASFRVQYPSAAPAYQYHIYGILFTVLMLANNKHAGFNGQ